MNKLKEEKKRNNWIDILRLLFTASIVMSHGTGYAKILPGFFPYGYEAVLFFFLLSGYFMGHSISCFDNKKVPADSVKIFFHKFVPIYFYFVTGFIWCFTCLHVLRHSSFRQTIVDLFSSIYEIMLVPQILVVINNNGLGNAYNGVAWYLSALFLAMMVLIPLVLHNQERFKRIIAPNIVIFGLGFCFLKWGGVSLMTGEVQFVLRLKFR